MKALIQFNKASGAYVNAFSYVPLERLNHQYYTYEEAEIDFDTQVVVGDVKTWKVVNRNEQPTVIYEVALNKLCRDKIEKEYEPQTQLGILTNVILDLAKKAKLSGESVDKLNEMVSYIEETRRRNVILKNAYAANKSFKYVTIEEQNKITEAQLDGGVHEFLGPRNLIDGL